MRTGSIQQVDEESTFVVLLDPDHFLCDVLARAADATNRQEQVILQKISCQHLPPATNNTPSAP